MNIGVVGAGRIGGGIAKQLAAAGRRAHAGRYTKSFNTLTSAFQAETAGRRADDRVVQWLCGDDTDAKNVVVGLIEDAGFVPVDLGGTADCAVMECREAVGMMDQPALSGAARWFSSA
jgi:8-hydroxy-5-deazaflavin:NADPH oxidoreductase